MIFTLPPACRPGAAGEALFKLPSACRPKTRSADEVRAPPAVGRCCAKRAFPGGKRPIIGSAARCAVHLAGSPPTPHDKRQIEAGFELEASVLKGGTKTKRRVTKERAKPEAPRPAVTQTPGHPDSTSEAAAAAFRGDQPTSKSWLVGTKPDRLVGPDHICRCRRGQFLVQNATHSQSKKCRPTNSGGICRPTNTLKVGWSEEQGE